MYKTNKLGLITGSDIELLDYPVKVHQPTISEIALIGEERFFSYFNIFQLDIENLKQNISDSFKDEYIKEKKAALQFNETETISFLISCDEEFKEIFLEMFHLLLKDYEIIIEDNLTIYFIKDDSLITFEEKFFNNLKQIIQDIFLFEKLFGESNFKPIEGRAKEIAEKLKKARQKVSNQNKNSENNSFFSNMISILGTQGYSFSELNNLTIYQLYNQFERFTLYMQYDQGMKAALAGAKVDIVDWFKEL